MVPHEARRPLGPEWPGPGTLLGGQPRYPLLWILLIAAASIASQGYLVGGGNQALQLPLIRYFAGDPAFAQDPLVRDLARTYTSVFYPLLGYAARLVPLPWLLFLAFVLLRVGTLYCGYRLSLALWRDGYAALWTAAALSLQTFNFASAPGQAISDVFLNHGGLAQVMALAALWLLATGRTVIALGMAGLMFNVHSLHSVHLMAAMGLAVLTASLNRRALFTLIAGYGVAAVLLSPTVYWMFRVGVMGRPDPAGYADSLRGWVPTHYWLSAWTPADWILFLVPWLSAVPLARLVGQPRDGGVVARTAVVSLICAAAGGLLSEFWESGPLLRLHPLRWTWVTLLAGIPFFARAAVQLVRRLERPDLPWSRVGGALGTMMLMALGVGVAYRSAFLLTLVPAMWLMARAPEDARPATRAEFALVAALPVLALLMPAIMALTVEDDIWAMLGGRDVMRRVLIAEGLVGGFAVAIIVAAWVQRQATPYTSRGRRALLRAAIVVAGVHLAARGLVVAQVQHRGMVRRWQEVQEWCATHLPRGARVVVPLDAPGLRAFSNQVPVVDFLEGAVLIHTPRYLPEYHGKLALFGYTPFQGTFADNLRNLAKLDEALTEERVQEIAQRTGALVAVRRSQYPAWRLPEVFRNERFVVYRLDPRPTGR